MNKKTKSSASRAKGWNAEKIISESATLIPDCRVALFSPSSGVSKKLARLTQAAAKEISVAAYAFSSKHPDKLLVNKVKRSNNGSYHS
jgi:hypothetical protein